MRSPRSATEVTSITLRYSRLRPDMPRAWRRSASSKTRVPTAPRKISLHELLPKLQHRSTSQRHLMCRLQRAIHGRRAEANRDADAQRGPTERGDQISPYRRTRSRDRLARRGHQNRTSRALDLCCALRLPRRHLVPVREMGAPKCAPPLQQYCANDRSAVVLGHLFTKSTII